MSSKRKNKRENKDNYGIHDLKNRVSRIEKEIGRFRRSKPLGKSKAKDCLSDNCRVLCDQVINNTPTDRLIVSKRTLPVVMGNAPRRVMPGATGGGKSTFSTSSSTSGRACFVINVKYLGFNNVSNILYSNGTAATPQGAPQDTVSAAISETNANLNGTRAATAGPGEICSVVKHFSITLKSNSIEPLNRKGQLTIGWARNSSMITSQVDQRNLKWSSTYDLAEMRDGEKPFFFLPAVSRVINDMASVDARSYNTGNEESGWIVCLMTGLPTTGTLLTFQTEYAYHYFGKWIEEDVPVIKDPMAVSCLIECVAKILGGRSTLPKNKVRQFKSDLMQSMGHEALKYLPDVLKTLLPPLKGPIEFVQRYAE